MIDETPFTSAGNGDRDPSSGRFVAGNRAGRGNPRNRQAQHLRCEMLEMVTEEDIEKIVRRLVAAAIDGDLNATRLLFDRLFGKPDQAVSLVEDGPPIITDVDEIRRRLIADNELLRSYGLHTEDTDVDQDGDAEDCNRPDGQNQED